MINKKAKNLIKEIKEILSNHYVNKDEIKKGFDDWFGLIKLPKRMVEFYEGIELCDADFDADWDNNFCVVRNDNWNVILYDAWNYPRNNAAWNFVRYYTWDANRDTVRNIVRSIYQDAAWNAAHNITWNATCNYFWNDARNCALDVYQYASCLNVCDKDDNCKICEFRRKFCEPVYNLFKNGLFAYLITKDKVIAITRPIIRHIDGRLHSEFMPAIEWENEKYYFLWDVKFEKDLWERIVSKSMSFKEIMKLKNIEHRMVALKMMDAEKLLKEAKAKLIDKSERGNELYLVENIFSQPAYFLKYKCPSTSRMYISGIEPEVAEQKPNADYLMSWKFGITLKDYFNLIES